MASDQQNEMMRSRSAGRTTSKQSLTQPTLLERGFINTYRDSVHAHDTRTEMLDTEANFATALLRLGKGPCHMPRRRLDPMT